MDRITAEEIGAGNSPELYKPSLRAVYRRLAIYCAVLLVANVLVDLFGLKILRSLGIWFSMRRYYVYIGPVERAWNMTVWYLGWLPLAAAILATGVSALPYRRLPYHQKLLRSFLLCLAVVYAGAIAAWGGWLLWMHYR
jgi:hypothetical protein